MIAGENDAEKPMTRIGEAAMGASDRAARIRGALETAPLGAWVCGGFSRRRANRRGALTTARSQKPQRGNNGYVEQFGSIWQIKKNAPC